MKPPKVKEEPRWQRDDVCCTMSESERDGSSDRCAISRQAKSLSIFLQRCDSILVVEIGEIDVRVEMPEILSHEIPASIGMNCYL
jgi:hypothetical protein